MRCVFVETFGVFLLTPKTPERPKNDTNDSKDREVFMFLLFKCLFFNFR